jgi:hypothetical protein
MLGTAHSGPRRARLTEQSPSRRRCGCAAAPHKMSKLLVIADKDANNVRSTDDIRRHYVASLKHANTTTFVENLKDANNAMLDRLKQIGKMDSDAVTLVELSPDLGYQNVAILDIHQTDTCLYSTESGSGRFSGIPLPFKSNLEFPLDGTAFTGKTLSSK